MSHNHNHHDSVKNIKVAFFLNVFFTIIEFIGGYLTNSIAIMSDALHDLGDSFSLGLAWFLEKFSSKEKTKKFSYGYKRFSLLGAFINAVVLLVGSLFIITEAIPRLINPEMTDARGMFILAIFGVLVNGFAVWKTSKGKTMNEKIISWHLLEDVLGWIAVLIMSVVMIFTDIYILDPILSILITLYILWGVLKNLKATVLLFLQAIPSDLDINFIENRLLQNDSVKDIHDTHVWSLDGEEHILSTHVVVSNTALKNDIENTKCVLKKELVELGISHSTLEIEFEGENCKRCC